MKVAIAVHGRFHGFDLAAGLYRRGLLCRLFTTYPSLIARRLLPPGLPLGTIPTLELARRMSEKTGLGRGLPVWVATRFDRFVARALPREADILVGWSGASLAAIREAKRRGIATVVERGSTHILAQADILSSLRDEWGDLVSLPEPRLIERELAEYEAADAIMVGSPTAAASFRERGVPDRKIFVNPYGIDASRYAPTPRAPRDGRLRVLFLGALTPRKGVLSLVRAFQALPGTAELVLAGPVRPEIMERLRPFAQDRIRFVGPVRGPALSELFGSADILCLPSVEEGFGLVILQAMASGIPVVATNVTGVSALAGEADGVLVVPPRDDQALAQALARLIGDTELRLELGRRARRRLEADFTVERYVDRAVAIYSGLVRRASQAAS